MTKHKYPCIDWLEEHSCGICRGIADERSFWTSEDWNNYYKEKKENDRHN